MINFYQKKIIFGGVDERLNQVDIIVTGSSAVCTIKEDLDISRLDMFVPGAPSNCSRTSSGYYHE
jgi:hypothetical protein